MRSTSLLVLSLALSAAPHGASAHIFKRVSHFAKRQTHSLARDLRVAFGGVLPRDYNAQKVIYCKNSAFGALEGSTTSDGSAEDAPGSGSSTKNGSGSVAIGTATGSAASGIPTSAWKLTESLSGDDFFDGWNFWDTADPTHGSVNYVGRSDGQDAGLIEVNSAGNAIMRVETTAKVSGRSRSSIRIHSKHTFTGGLVIMDAVHMPTGCGTWPAFWSNGPNWPAGGEIDIVEGVNDYTHNQATIHTDPGCALTTDDPRKLDVTAVVVTGGTDCAAATSGNMGCGMRDSSSKSYGAGFNSNGGGVYALLWVSSGISVWFWERQDVPSDVDAGVPSPKTWGLPFARWASSVCDPWKFFYDHIAIFDTTLCGDWAGNVWSSTGIPGQEQSCATRTGYSTCEDFVANNGASFAEAYWEVSYVKFYNQTSSLH
ncbi:GH16 domain-containing protein [Mycena kentingensis (nom. inval.)]|nr:GH16 domain-containing protein [Mycena kentingensis (nom. inval.)]